MKNMKLFLKWIYGIGFIIAGIIILFSTSFVGGLMFILCGLILFPPTFGATVKNMNKPISKSTKYAFILITFVVGTIFFAMDKVDKDEKNDSEVDKIVQEAKELIEKGDMEGATIKLNEAKSKYSSSDNNAVDLEKSINKSKSCEFAKEVLADMSDKDYAKLKRNEFDTMYFELSELNKNFILLIKDYEPDRKQIKIEIEQKREQERIQEEQRRIAVEKAERKRKIEEELFSPWDGSHRGLKKLVKENMNDPDSFEHIETRYIDYGTHLYVTMKFRGKNAFGGKVINTIAANCDYDGNVIEIISQD